MHFQHNLTPMFDDKLSFIYISDLHFETEKNPDYKSFIKEKHSDIIILAGDVHKGTKAVDFIKHLISLGYVVIYTLGNHEFWENSIDDVINQWRDISKTIDNFYFLEKDIVTINDVDFLGTCLWTSLGTKDLQEEIDWFLKQALKPLNDFELTKGLKPDIMRHLFFQSKEFIFNNLDDDRKQVVITHYSPSELSALEIYKNDTIRTLFFSELGNEISYTNIRYWIHGHMHNSSDYMINETNLLCNPRGYSLSKSMLNDDFYWHKLIKFI